MAEIETVEGTVLSLLTYNPETGGLYWKPRTVSMFKGTSGRTPEHACANWNARHAGQKAFTAKGNHGYLVGRIFGRSYLAHRVIMCLMTGKWPDQEVDHINGDRTDNRWQNLRKCNHAQNSRNARGYSKTSDYLGVSWNASLKGYMARVYCDGKTYYCGFSKTDPEKLARQRDRKAVELFGEYARLNFPEKRL